MEPVSPGEKTEITALLGRGTHFEGKLFFEGRIRVDGSFRGEIRGEDVLVIGDGAQVVGDIEVSTCIVTGGQVEANIRARDAIELYAPSRVVGDLHAPAIFIDRGVLFEGSCKMAPLGPADEAAPDEGPADAAGRAAAPNPWLTEATIADSLDDTPADDDMDAGLSDDPGWPPRP